MIIIVFSIHVSEKKNISNWSIEIVKSIEDKNYSLSKNIASKKLNPASIPPKKKKFEMADSIVKGLVISASNLRSLGSLRLHYNQIVYNGNAQFTDLYINILVYSLINL